MEKLDPVGTLGGEREMGRFRIGTISPSLSFPKSFAQEKEKTSRPGLWGHTNHALPRVTKVPTTLQDPGRAPLCRHRRQGALPASRPRDRRLAGSPGCKGNAGGPGAKLHSPEAVGDLGAVLQKPPPSASAWAQACSYGAPTAYSSLEEEAGPHRQREKPAQQPQGPHGPRRGSDGVGIQTPFHKNGNKNDSR